MNKVAIIENELNPEFGIGSNPNMVIMGVHNPGANAGFFLGSYKGDSLTTVFNSFVPQNAIELLFQAVNNRTVERNYFRLYSQLLEGTISEEFFDQEIANNEDDYVIVTDKRPSLDDIRAALLLATRIKDIDSSTDLSTAFSFSPDETDHLLTLPELSDGNL